MHIKYRDNEFSLHSRDDRVLDTLKVFSDGLYNAVQNGVSQRMIQETAKLEDPKSSYWPWSYTKSCLDYSVRGISNLVGKTVLPRDWNSSNLIQNRTSRH